MFMVRDEWSVWVVDGFVWPVRDALDSSNDSINYLLAQRTFGCCRNTQTERAMEGRWICEGFGINFARRATRLVRLLLSLECLQMSPFGRR